MLMFVDFILITASILIGTLGSGILIAQYIREALRERKSKLTFNGIIMYKVKADSPDIPFTITVNAKDSEGNPVIVDPSSIAVEVSSSNEDLVSLVMDDDGSDLSGVIHIGRPSADDAEIASLEATISYNGTVVDIVGAQFVVTTGDPVDFGGSTIEFDGLTESDPLAPTE